MRRDQLEHRATPPDLSLDVTSLMHSVQGEAIRVNQLRSNPSGGPAGQSAPPPPSMLPVAMLQPVPELQPKMVEGKQLQLEEEELLEMIPRTITLSQCQKIPPLPNWDKFPTVIFAPSQEKNFSVDQVKDLLSVSIDHSVQYPLDEPHHPPICGRLLTPLPSVLDRMRQTGASLLPCDEAEEYISQFGFEEDLHEAGHRIAEALQKKVGPKWVVYNLAALYWRAVGNLWNGIECLRALLGSNDDILGQTTNMHEDAGHDYTVGDAPEDPDEYEDIDDVLHTDIALGNLASVLYAVGNVDDALIVAKRAAELAQYDVSVLVLHVET